MNANDQMTESIAKATKHRWANSWRAAAGPLSSLQLLRSHDNERSREGETEEHPFIGDEQTDDRPESPLFRISSTSSGSSSPSSLHPLHKQMEDEEHLSQASWNVTEAQHNPPGVKCLWPLSLGSVLNDQGCGHVVAPKRTNPRLQLYEFAGGERRKPRKGATYLQLSKAQVQPACQHQTIPRI